MALSPYLLRTRCTLGVLLVCAFAPGCRDRVLSNGSDPAAVGASGAGASTPLAGGQESVAAALAESPGAAMVTLDHFEFGGDFTLTDHQGRPFSLADHRGKLGLLFFGYSLCPDVCPMTLSRISQALEALGDARREVEVYFVSVDPARDTPEALAAYVEGLGVPVVGLTGSREAIDRVVAQYRATYDITPSTSAAGPLVNHTTYTYLLDRQGRIRLLIRYGESPATIAAGLRAALAEGTPATSSSGAALEPAPTSVTEGTRRTNQGPLWPRPTV